MTLCERLAVAKAVVEVLEDHLSQQLAQGRSWRSLWPQLTQAGQWREALEDIQEEMGDQCGAE